MLTLQNQEFDEVLSFTQGDDVVLALRLVGDDGLPVVLHEDATLTTVIAGPNGELPVAFGPDFHSVEDQGVGCFLLTLETDDTDEIGLGVGKCIFTEVTDEDGLLSTYRGVNILNVYSAVPPQ